MTGSSQSIGLAIAKGFLDEGAIVAQRGLVVAGCRTCATPGAKLPKALQQVDTILERDHVAV